jgi:transcriptional regulator GlxA family with amidase domain
MLNQTLIGIFDDVVSLNFGPGATDFACWTFSCAALPRTPWWMLRDIAAPGTALSRIGVTIRWIRENFTVPLRVEALASMPALSISAFHRHFKAVTALSPLQYQKRIRLLHARSPLIAGEGNTTSVAFGVGYESPTQFSREYSRFFGLPPSRDSRQIVRALQPIS